MSRQDSFQRVTNNEKIRVLYINATSIIGGAETNLLNILRFADDGGIQPVGNVPLS